MSPEEKLYEYLTSKLTVPVFFDEEGNTAKTFVVVERVGGAYSGFIRSVSFAIRSCAGTMLDALKLNESVFVAMQDLIQEDWVTKVTLDSDYNFTDTSTKRYRYQAIYDLVIF